MPLTRDLRAGALRQIDMVRDAEQPKKRNGWDMAPDLRSRVYAALDPRPVPIVETVFVSPEILHRDNAAQRKDRLADVVAKEILPRLLVLHSEVVRAPSSSAPSQAEIAELARLVLSPDLHAAAAYVTLLRDRGLPMETLFVELLEPAAQHLGRMWDNDECDFIDVTLGVGQLQKLLAIFNCTYDIPAISEKRRIFMTTGSDEQHSFGVSMVCKLLRASGWNVDLADGPSVRRAASTVAGTWYAVAGIAIGSGRRLEEAGELVAAIRQSSRNPAIGVMIGGAHLANRPGVVSAVGADGTAVNAATAVLLAQKLFDIGARAQWQRASTPPARSGGPGCN